MRGSRPERHGKGIAVRLAPPLAGMLLAVSCTSAAPTAPSAAAPSEPAAVARPADLSEVVRRTAVSFRSEGGAIASAATTFQSRIDARGALEITPRRGSDRGQPLSLSTRRITRGRADLSMGGGSPTLEADGAVTIVRGDVVERLVSDDKGIEQSWHLASAPNGEGDLVIRVRASGPSFFASTSEGLHFRDGSLGLRYGIGTFVDAAGVRTTLTPRVEGDDIVLDVPDHLLRSARYPAVIDPTVSAEREVDLPIAGSSAATGDQYNPSIVPMGKGAGYLAIWYDRRGIRPAIYGARIDSTGLVRDATGILIATGVGYTTPSVAAGDTGFFVTWSISNVDPYQAPGVYGVRLDPNAVVLDPAPIAVAPNVNNASAARAAFGANEWLATWTVYSAATSYDVAAVRVSAAGLPLDAAPVAIAKTADTEYQPTVLYDGTSFLVAYRSNQTILGRNVGVDGQPVGSAVSFFSGPSLNDYGIAYDGATYTVVWSAFNAATSSSDLSFRRFQKSLVPVGPVPTALTNDVLPDDRPRAVFDGTNTLVTWLRSSQLYAQRIGVDPAPVAIASGAYYDYDVATDGAGSIAVNREYGGSTLVASDVRGVRITAAPAAATPFLVSKAANAETQPSLAWSGTSHYVAWLDTRDGQLAIWGARLDADGKADAPEKLVADPNVTDLARPRVVSDGSDFLLVYYALNNVGQRRGLRALRIDAQGHADPAGSFDVAYVPTNGPTEINREPDVAFDGTNYFIVWEQQTQEGTAVVGQRFARAARTPVDAQVVRVSPRNPVERRLAPSVGFDGQSYFVAWVATRPTPNSIEVTHIAGSRVSREGSVLDGEIVVCNAFLLQRAPSVAANPKAGGFMVVWEDYRTALDTADVYGARIAPNGENLDGPAGAKISAGAHDESGPRVTAAGDGSNFIVAWRDLRSKQTYDLYGAWVSRAGTNHDPNGFLLSADLGDEEAPALSASSEGRTLLAYQRLDPNSGYGAYRVRARAVEGGLSIASTCAKNDDCASRSCADGVCCATECGGCGVCNVTPGTCTPRSAGAEAATCPSYKCQGTLACPSRCDTDADCAANSTCDPSGHTCVSRILCVDDHTLKDLTGKLTECAPFKCTGDACRTQCGSVDDCASGFVCDLSSRCVPAPGPEDTGGCSAGGSSDGSRALAWIAGLGWVVASIARRRQNTRSTRS